jgi:hypothetical protein
MPMLSYREKVLSSALCINLCILVPYFSGVLRHPASTEWMGTAITTMLVCVFGAEFLIAFTARGRRVDERDRWINARSSKSAYVSLILGIAGVLMLLASGPTIASGLVINALIGAVCFAYNVQIVTQLAAYRRAA